MSDEDPTSTRQPAGGVTKQPGGGPETILVVDDDEAVRAMLVRLLRTSGYRVEQANNAQRAWEQIGREAPDLVISDISMPGDSGIDLRRVLLVHWPAMPVILISGYSAEGPAEFAARTPKTTFVQKPFAAEHLLALIERTLAAIAPAS